jgi:outer membrane biosynthesis protein TonB
MTSDRAETSANPPVAAASPISLTDVCALQVPIHWAEAVAVVQDVGALLAGGRVVAGIPDLADVAITSAGTVMIRRGATGRHDVDELGRMLNRLLDIETSPMPLRLFVAHSLVSSKYTSVSAFLDALAYYARPNREELIRSLYSRCLDAPSHTPEEVPPKAPPVPLDEPPARRRHATRALAFAVVAATLVAAAGVIWLWRDAPRVSASLAQVRGAVTSAAAAIQQMTSGDSGPEAAVDSGSDGPKPSRQASSPRVPRQPRLAVDATAAFLAPGAEPDHPTGSVGGITAAPAGAIDRVPLGPAPTIGSGAADAIYSSAAEGVQPPVWKHPKLPPFVPVDPRVGGTNTMELRIDESGDVTQVQLVTPPVRMSDMLLLSTAKTWKFHPAIKDGRPVKYRLSLSWVVTPP